MARDSPGAPAGVPPGVPAETKAEWRWQRGGMWLLTVVVIGALAGAFGNGPLSRGRLEAHGLIVEYERIVHWRSPTRLRLAPVQGAARPVEVALDRHFLDGVRIEQIVPRPAREASTAGWTSFTLALAPAAAVSIDYTPERIGLCERVVRLDAEAPLTFRQLVLP